MKKLKEKVKGIIKLTKPQIILVMGLPIALASVIIATGTFPPIGDFLIFFILLAIFYTGSLAIDDYFDFEADKINVPNRAIPSGKLTREEVLVVSNILLTTSAVGIGILFDKETFILVVLTITWAYIAQYIGCFTRIPFAIQILTPSYTGIVGILIPWAAFAKLNSYAFLFYLWWIIWDFAHDTPSGMVHEEGDRASGKRSVPIVLGRKNAAKVSLITRYVCYLILSVVFYYAQVGILAYAAILLSLVISTPYNIALIRNPTNENAAKTYKVFTLDIPLIAIALILDMII